MHKNHNGSYDGNVTATVGIINMCTWCIVKTSAKAKLISHRIILLPPTAELLKTLPDNNIKHIKPGPLQGAIT